MKLGLEELREQRELVLKHLRWLESKIAALEGGDAGAEKEAAVRPPPPPPPPPVKPVAPQASTTPEPLPTAKDDLPIPGVPHLRARTASDIRTARVGCFLIFVAACALFLFLLFGLPYLIDADEPHEKEEPPVEETSAGKSEPAGTPFRP